MKTIITHFLCFNFIFLYETRGASANLHKQALYTSYTVVGTQTLLFCPNAVTKPSVIAYAAGGITYLLTSLSDNKKTQKQREEIRKNLRSETDQLKSQESILDELQVRKDSAMRKKRHLNISSAIYSTAAALAALEALKVFGVPVVCTPSKALSLIPEKFHDLLKGTGMGMGPLGFIATVLGGSLTSAPTRIALFGVLTGLSVNAKNEVIEERRKLDDDINNQKKLINELKKMTADQRFDQLKINPEKIIADHDLEEYESITNEPLELSDFPEESLGMCVNKSNYSLQDKGCQNKLNLHDLSQMAVPVDHPLLKKSWNNILGYAEAITTGHQQAAKDYAQAILADAPAVEELNKKLQADLNKKLALEGKPLHQFEKETQDLLSQMNEINGPKLASQGSEVSENEVTTYHQTLPKVERQETVISSTPILDDEEQSTNMMNASYDAEDALKEISLIEDLVPETEGRSLFERISKQYLTQYPLIFDKKNQIKK